MQFTYCPDCGARLVDKEIGDEGLIPYCESCKKPLFPIFATCIIALVVNEYGEAVLLQQDYISTQYRNLVSGYMKPGESAEDTVMREIEEEIGVSVDTLSFAGTYWFAKKDMLMIGFIAHAKKCKLRLSKEVDAAEWISAKQALAMVHPKGSVSYTLIDTYLNGGR